MDDPDTNDIAGQLSRVRQEILLAERQYGRLPGSVNLLAVSKGHPVTSIREAIVGGQLQFGESYLQEARDKIQGLEVNGLLWHFIGPIQSNKTRDIARLFDWVHGVDRLKVAIRLSEQRPERLPPLNLCLQVNIDHEPSKRGIAPEELTELACEVEQLPCLRLRGLMAIPRQRARLEEQREGFAALRKAIEGLRLLGHELDTLSMGMSDDMRAAIAEGATIVRIGTAIFGPRPRK